MAVWFCVVLSFVLCLHALLFCQAIPGIPARVLNYSLSPFDPYTLDNHQTRYVFGCFDELHKYYKTYPYSMIMPFVYNFDYILAPCHINWRDISQEFSNINDDCLLKVIKHPNITDVHSNSNDGILRVSIRNIKFSIDKFIDDIYKHFYGQKQKIILHIGTRDNHVFFSQLEKIIDSPTIVRFVIEQGADVRLTNHPKVLYLPVGLCFRENVLHGDDLRRAINSIGSNISSISSISSSNNSNSSDEFKDTATIRKLLSDSMSSLGISLINNNNTSSSEKIDSHRVLRELSKVVSRSVKWEDRKDRIFICFSHKYNRAAYINWGLHNCTVCDVCTDSKSLHYLDHVHIWTEYAKYKYIMSPHGNGQDCGRSWEIMLLGAIPLIEYFEGANGYLQGNLTAILVHKPQELTAANISVWNKLYDSGTPPERLTRKYWNDRAFGL